MSDYIKITYADGEVWKARYDVEREHYCSDDVMLHTCFKKSEYKLSPCEFVCETFEELKKDKNIKVEIITGEEYKKHVNGLMLEFLNDEIAELEDELKDKISRRTEFILVNA
jgi:hypothetical protein